MFIKPPNLKNALKTIATVAIALGGVLTSTVAQAIQLNITYAPGTTLDQRTSVEMAKNIVSSYLTQTDVTVNIHVGMNSNMSTSYLALATPAIVTNKSYSDVYTALNNSQSLLNTTAFKYIPQSGKVTTSSSFSLTSSLGTFTTPNMVMMTSANAKVLDLRISQYLMNQYNGLDGYIQLNGNVAWNYNYTQSDSTKYDLTTIAIHEIIHALGCISGIDPSKIKIPQPTTLDLFRYSTQSAGQGAIEFRQGSNSYLSNDRGQNPVTSEAYFSRGQNTSLGGDGYQTSHWVNNPSSPKGIMNPTQYVGQKTPISQLDLKMLDLIGYNVDFNATPNLSALYSQAQSQAASATIIDQTTAVTNMIANSGVYETDPSGGGTCTTNCGWFERTAEWQPNGHHDHDH